MEGEKIRNPNEIQYEVRCRECEKLLFKGKTAYGEIQCPRCNAKNILKFDKQ